LDNFQFVPKEFDWRLLREKQDIALHSRGSLIQRFAQTLDFDLRRSVTTLFLRKISHFTEEQKPFISTLIFFFNFFAAVLTIFFVLLFFFQPLFFYILVAVVDVAVGHLKKRTDYSEFFNKRLKETKDISGMKKRKLRLNVRMLSG